MYIRGPCVSSTPPPRAESFFDQNRYFTIFNDIFKFNFLALVDSEIIGGPKFILGALHPLNAPIADTFLYPKRVLYYL